MRYKADYQPSFLLDPVRASLSFSCYIPYPVLKRLTLCSPPTPITLGPNANRVSMPRLQAWRPLRVRSRRHHHHNHNHRQRRRCPPHPPPRPTRLQHLQQRQPLLPRIHQEKTSSSPKLPMQPESNTTTTTTMTTMMMRSSTRISRRLLLPDVSIRITCRSNSWPKRS
jgi:hypothetical protein